MAEIIAASLDPDDINAAENSSSEGDTIVLPAGDNSHADWCVDNGEGYNAAVVIRAGRNLRGQGLASTITRQTSTTTVRFFFFNPARSATTYSTEISGFRCIGPGITASTGYGISVRGLPQINIHHIQVEYKSTVLLAIEDCDLGVVWKSTFCYSILTTSYGSGGYGIAVKGAYPYTWPASYPAFGTANAIFIEDNIIFGCKHAIQGQDCANYVARYNTLSVGWGPHGMIDMHGARDTEGENSSGVHFECYGNDISLSTHPDSTFYPNASYGSGLRGGHGVFWNNKFHSWGNSQPIRCVRLTDTDILAHTVPAYSYPADYYITWQTRDIWAWGNIYDGAAVNISESSSWFELNRYSGKLNFKSQTVNFTLNDKITGGTSGAYGYLTKQTDAGATGTLWLRNVIGIFQDNEPITGALGGSANADGVLYDAYYDYRDDQPEGYQPYIYPHPLRGGNPPSPPPGPVIPPVDKLLTADIGKNIILDWELARKLEAETWTADADPGGTAYFLDFEDGEVNRVVVDGTAYTEKFSVTDVQATASTIYFDLTNQRLYVQTADSDDPGTYVSGMGYKYCFIAYFWKGVSNTGVTLARETEILVDGKLDLWSDAATLKHWSKTTAGTGTVVREATSVYDVNSAYSAKLSAGDTSAAIYQDIITRPSAWQRVRFKYVSDSATPSFKLRIRNSGSNIYLNEDGNWQAGATNISLPGATSWTEFEIIFQAHASYSAYRISITNDTANSILYVDNAEWRRRYEPQFYDPYLRYDSIPNLSLSVGTWHEPEEQISFGSVRFTNDGFWWQKKDIYLWSNKNMEFRIGETDDEYDEYVPIFFGQSRRPEWTLIGFQVDTKDVRSTLINNCASVARFDSTTYPNCETAWVNRGVPILLGNVENITPPCSNTATHVYKVTQTVFGGVTYPMYELTYVYKDGVLQTLTTHYTVDLNAGTFTMVSDPGTSVISCDAYGIKCDFEEDAYASEIAKFLYFFLKRINGIPETKLNLKSFLNLYDKRTIEAQEYITDDMDFRDLLNKWKRSNSFQIFQSCEGEWFARALVSTLAGNELEFRNPDFLAFNSWEDTDQIYKWIEVKKDQDPTTGEWEVCVNDTTDDPDLNRAEWEHGEKRTLQLETSIKNYYQGNAVANAYGNILNHPLPMIRAVLPARGLLLNPTDKIIVSYAVEMSDGTVVTVFDTQAFIILAITKDFQNAQAEVLAVKNVADLSWEV